MELRTKRLRVRPFQPSDLEGLYGLVSDEAVMRYIEPPYSREQAAGLLERALREDPPFGCAVDDSRGRFIGYVIYHPYDRDAWELGWLLRADQWHKGYGDELTKALIADAGGKTRRLVIECSPEQTASRAIALKNGFTYRGREDGRDVYELELRQGRPDEGIGPRGVGLPL